MRSKLWFSLIDTIYQKEYVLEYLTQKESQLNHIEFWLSGFTVIGISGWLKFAEGKLVWSVLLTGITAFRLFKSKIFLTEAEIITLKSVYEFYSDHLIEFENLWYELENKNLSDSKVEKKLKSLISKDREMSKIQKYKQIPFIKKIDDIVKGRIEVYVRKFY